MNRHLSKSVQTLRPSGIRRYFDIAATMDDVVTLGIGEPNFVTPAHILEAGVQSLRAGETGYTSNAGTAELRAALTAHIESRYGLHYAPEDEVLITVGVSEALFLALKVLLDQGDEVLVAEPCFVANPALVEMAGGAPVPVPTCVDDDFQVTGTALEARITPRTKAILISYPSNPTGAVLTREHMLQVAEVARRHDLVVISDEIYERLVYGSQHINFATLPGMVERTIVLGGMSKSYAMTGWRIGYATAPARLYASHVQAASIPDYVRADHGAGGPRCKPSAMAKTTSSGCGGVMTSGGVCWWTDSMAWACAALSRAAHSTPSPASPSPAWMTRTSVKRCCEKSGWR